MNTELDKIRLEVLKKCWQFLNDYMTEERDRREKKILAQKFLEKAGVLKHKSRPQLKLRYEILKRDDFKCVYCGRTSEEVVLEIDHVNPVAIGGDSNPENLVTACKDCNIGKCDFLLNERQQEKFVSQNRKRTDAKKAV